jgi:hypothetical protein
MLSRSDLERKEGCEEALGKGKARTREMLLAPLCFASIELERRAGIVIKGLLELPQRHIPFCRRGTRGGH